MIDGTAQRASRQGKPDTVFIKPAAIADEIWHVVYQDRSAWSFNVEVRSYGEEW